MIYVIFLPNTSLRPKGKGFACLRQECWLTHVDHILSPWSLPFLNVVVIFSHSSSSDTKQAVLTGLPLKSFVLAPHNWLVTLVSFLQSSLLYIASTDSAKSLKSPY